MSNRLNANHRNAGSPSQPDNRSGHDGTNRRDVLKVVGGITLMAAVGLFSLKSPSHSKGEGGDGESFTDNNIANDVPKFLEYRRPLVNPVLSVEQHRFNLSNSSPLDDVIAAELAIFPHAEGDIRQAQGNAVQRMLEPYRGGFEVIANNVANFVAVEMIDATSTSSLDAMADVIARDPEKWIPKYVSLVMDEMKGADCCIPQDFQGQPMNDAPMSLSRSMTAQKENAGPIINSRLATCMLLHCARLHDVDLRPIQNVHKIDAYSASLSTAIRLSGQRNAGKQSLVEGGIASVPVMASSINISNSTVGAPLTAEQMQSRHFADLMSMEEERWSLFSPMESRVRGGMLDEIIAKFPSPDNCLLVHKMYGIAIKRAGDFLEKAKENAKYNPMQPTQITNFAQFCRSKCLELETAYPYLKGNSGDQIVAK